MDPLVVRAAWQVVRREEGPSEPGTAVAVPDGAAPDLFEPEPVSGDVPQLFEHSELSPEDFGMDGDRPYVVASALARALGYARTQKLTNLLEPDEKGYRQTVTPGGSQAVTVVYEQGIWRAIFRSDKPEARALTGRVTEILTEIRKTGGYIAPAATPTQLDQLAEEIEARLTLSPFNLNRNNERIDCRLQGFLRRDYFVVMFLKELRVNRT
jgi:prophage antirepressor-like protein